MVADTAISWADDTINWWIGCAKVSAGCANCYAERWASRWLPTARLWQGDHLLRAKKARGELERSIRRARMEDRPRRVFFNSLADVFEDHPALVPARLDLWAALRDAGRERLADGRPAIIPLLLTKRPDVMVDWCRRYAIPPSAWLGVTVEGQAQVQRLLDIACLPADVRWASFEPLLEPIDLFGAGAIRWRGHAYDRSALTALDLLDPLEDPLVEANFGWGIIGGESGPGARPIEARNIDNLVGQLAEARVPTWVKQTGCAMARALGLESYAGEDHTEPGFPIRWRIREAPVVPRLPWGLEP